MAKQCKSCGNYYEGEYCDKCGYGKKPAVSKAAKKYKKVTKPERFQSEEDKAVYQQWAKEKKPPKRDPKAGVKLLVIVAVVVVGVIFAVLYKSGVIFSSTKTEVVTNYFNSITEGDFSKFKECFPSQIKDDYESDLKQSGLSENEYMNELYSKGFKETYGDDYTIEVEFGRETKLSESDYDMTEYKAQYGSAPKISEAYEIVANVTFKGSQSSETAKLYINVAKTSGSWKIFNITEDNGILEDESGADSSQAE